MKRETVLSATRGVVILAGGASRRFGGGEKALASLEGRPIISHVIDRFRLAQTALAINTPNLDAFASFGLPLLPDTLQGGLGPLAGVLTAMRWGEAQGFEAVFTAPADTPFLPGSLLDDLARPGAPIVMAQSGGQVHHICARWSCALADDLEQALQTGGVRAVWAYAGRHACEVVDFEIGEGPDPFFNINTAADLERAADLLARWTG